MINENNVNIYVYRSEGFFKFVMVSLFEVVVLDNDLGIRNMVNSVL